jgi:hypothetical protein
MGRIDGCCHTMVTQKEKRTPREMGCPFSYVADIARLNTAPEEGLEPPTR